MRAQDLKRLVNGDLGVSSGALSLAACPDKATAHAKRLAKGGDIAAQFQLGRGFRYIRGEPDVRWPRRAAEGGHSRAQGELGNALYDRRSGLAKDWKRSSHWIRLAAEQEDSAAQVDLSLAHSFGEGVEKNRGKAMYWLNKALRNRDAGAECSLDVSCFDGDGLPMNKEP